MSNETNPADKPERKPSWRSRLKQAWGIDIPQILAAGVLATLGSIVGSYLTYLTQTQQVALQKEEVTQKYATQNAELEQKYAGLQAELQRKYDNLDAEVEVKYLAANREVDLKMIDISLAILAGQKGGADAAKEDGYVLARDFAIQALSKASGIPILDEARGKWARSGALSTGAIAERQPAMALKGWQLTETAIIFPLFFVFDISIAMSPPGDCELSAEAFDERAQSAVTRFINPSSAPSLVATAELLGGWKALFC